MLGMHVAEHQYFFSFIIGWLQPHYSIAVMLWSHDKKLMHWDDATYVQVLLDLHVHRSTSEGLLWVPIYWKGNQMFASHHNTAPLFHGCGPQMIFTLYLSITKCRNELSTEIWDSAMFVLSGKVSKVLNCSQEEGSCGICWWGFLE